jgi:hypothetical protein
MTTFRSPSETARDLHVNVRARGVELKSSHYDAIQKTLTSALGRFAGRVRQVNLFLEDENGPRGGVDIRCRIEIHFRPRGSVTVSALTSDEYVAIAEAAMRARGLVDRRLKKVWSHRRKLPA